MASGRENGYNAFTLSCLKYFLEESTFIIYNYLKVEQQWK